MYGYEQRILKRWVPIPQSKNTALGPGGPPKQLIKIPQFRTKQTILSHPGYMWSEWQDVPEVDEEETDVSTK